MTTIAPKKNRLVIMVLDDNDLVVDLVTFAFQNQKVSVIGAADGKEALRMLAERPFDLVITDLKMPGMSGIEFIGNVRASSAFGKVPIIALTGYEGETNQEQAKQAGASAYLKKPFTPEDLQACVRKVLTGR